MQVYIEDIAKYVGKEVIIKGWLYNKRSSGKIWFLLVRDGTGIIQTIISQKDVLPEIFEAAESVTQESSVILKGVVREEHRAPGGYEIDIRDFKIIQLARDYPISPKEHGTEFLMAHRHLWLRSRKQNAILRIRSTVVQAIRDFFRAQGFVQVDTPILTPNAVEGTTTLFALDYFGETAYLTQSGQLYNEATAAALGRVYSFGPTFRAEKSKTRRHLMEFWMVEPEVAYIDFDDLKKLAEDNIIYIVERCLEERKEELKVLERDPSKLEKVKKPFPQISYDEAVKILTQAGEKFEWGEDFGGGPETILSSKFEKPVIIQYFPAAIKAFYMKRLPTDDRLVLGMDILAPEGYGEIVGGSMREDDYDTLLKRINEHKLPLDAFQWYLDLRKYGTCPHGGYGLGLERVIAWLCGIPHIRETIAFPRMLEKIYP
ncbi:MAG: asparagine--tRNA ligase [candidate division WOR-3 bacterium]